MKKIVVAIDGFSSTGKSTLAKALAERLGYLYIDSGAMYRAITLYLLDHEITPAQQREVKEALHHIHLTLDTDGIHMNGRLLKDEIRSLAVSNLVSEVSADVQVRNFAVQLQQQWGMRKGVVMDGRDIGTTVFPQAELKIYLTADAAIRTQRRYEEMKRKHPDIRVEDVQQNLEHRDHLDATRTFSPLRQAPDALVLDNTHLSEAEQVDIASRWAMDRIQTVSV